MIPGVRRVSAKAVALLLIAPGMGTGRPVYLNVPKSAQLNLASIPARSASFRQSPESFANLMLVIGRLVPSLEGAQGAHPANNPNESMCCLMC
jgi:hypothetical protein